MSSPAAGAASSNAQQSARPRVPRRGIARRFAYGSAVPAGRLIRQCASSALGVGPGAGSGAGVGPGSGTTGGSIGGDGSGDGSGICGGSIGGDGAGEGSGTGTGPGISMS